MNKIVYVMLVFLLISLPAIRASGAAPELMNYQGRLVDAGVPVNKSVAMQLRLYDAKESGNLLYEDSNSVVVVDGLYSTLFGDDTTFGSLTNALTNLAVYVEVVVDGQALTPRDRLTAVAYALNGAKGDTGAAGAQGIQGPAGTNGVDGAQGIQGIQGPAGTNGLDGAQGIQGIQGLPGTNGLDGAQGIQGSAGTNGVDGATGPQGIQGIQGPAGTNGLDGAKGDTGAAGAQGIQGPAGTNGVDGAQGIQGIQGPAGTNGLDGAQGIQGIQGLPGTNGVDGATGPMGPAGTNGLNGTDGAAGAAGASGADGKSVLNGSGVPEDGWGVIGDFYLDTATSMLYGPKASLTTWPATGVSLKGSDGATGAQGPAGTNGLNGTNADMQGTNNVFTGTTNTFNNMLIVSNVTIAGNVILTNTVWDDMVVPLVTAGKAGAYFPPAFKKVAAVSGEIWQYAFEPIRTASSEQETMFSVQLPHSYKRGSNISPHIHWIPSTTNAGDVVWGLEYIAGPTLGMYPTASTTSYVTNTITPGTNMVMMIIEWPDIPGINLQESSCIFGRVFRYSRAGSGDTYEGDAIGVSFDIHFEKNSLGSDGKLPQ